MSKKQKQQQHVSCASSTSTSATNGYNASSAVNFNAESLEYYPPACCEILHVTNAVYLATVLQILFVVLLSIFYHFLERNNFIVAVEIFRPAVIFIICVNAVGIVCALIGILLQQDVLVSAQIALLAALCVLADLVALALVGAMAFGGGKWRQPQTVAFVSDDATTAHHHQQHQQQQHITVTGRLTFAPTFIDERRFEAVLGAFWIYLVAILFHMCAAAIMCVIGVYRRYGKFLKRCVRAVIEDGAPALHALECPHACERRWDPFMWLFSASALITCILGVSIAAMAITLERREQKFIHLEIEESSTERKRAACNPTTLNNDGNKSGSDSDCGDGRMSEGRVSTALDNNGQKRRRSGGHSHGSSNAHRRRTAMPTIDETVS